ncbi:glycosyltransferase [Acidianus sulfidivorans JP7]|uniref:Glycosyl transferase family 1 n=1 Tax=Acidianus sulfidivorans JP7 TaxID=619593 RepID=A0A2U9IKD5_9CREN|nr:glycosyltransferase family 4 protein [Acidianus sulfidivorans]AWR96436.1 glycosyltransferase [Acidianus sulfidivorans JP7]
MEEINVAVIAHGLGMSKGYSGEGNVYKAFFDMLQEKGIKFVAVSFSKPYSSSYNSVYTLPFHLPRFDKYQRLLVYFTARRLRPKLFLNASGTPIPLSNIAPHVIYAGAPSISSVPSKYSKSLFWKLYLLPFRSIVSRFKDEAKRAKIIANSYYSAKAIAETYDIPVPKVIYPPVDVEFYSKAFDSSNRENIFVTIARFERGKMIENSIIFASKSGIKGIVIGSMNDRKYFEELQKLKKKLNANVDFLPNLSKEEILNILSKAKIYFHPTIGEHFGIPIIEAISAGLIPIVPKESGGSELVPEFSYNTIDEAVEIAKNILNSNLENKREELHNLSMNFSISIFKEKIYEEINKLIEG